MRSARAHRAEGPATLRIQHRAVPRRAHVERNRLAPPAHANLVAAHVQRQPLIAGAISLCATRRVARRKNPARRRRRWSSPHPMRALWPMMTKGMPGIVTPATFSVSDDDVHFPPDRRHFDHRDADRWQGCGRPDAVRDPWTTQLLLIARLSGDNHSRPGGYLSIVHRRCQSADWHVD